MHFPTLALHILIESVKLAGCSNLINTSRVLYYANKQLPQQQQQQQLNLKFIITDTN